jgi:hypothetical protein
MVMDQVGHSLQTKFARSLLLEPGTSSNHFVGLSLMWDGDSSLLPISRINIVLQSVSVFV